MNIKLRLARLFHTHSAATCCKPVWLRWPRVPRRTVCHHTARLGIASAALPVRLSPRLATNVREISGLKHPAGEGDRLVELLVEFPMPWEGPKLPRGLVMDGAVETIRRDCANTVEEKIANARIRRVNMRRSPSKRGFTTNEGTGLLTSGLAMMSDLPACAVIARRDYLPVTVAGQRRTLTVFPNIPTRLTVLTRVGLRQPARQAPKGGGCKGHTIAATHWENHAVKPIKRCTGSLGGHDNLGTLFSESESP